MIHTHNREAESPTACQTQSQIMLCVTGVYLKEIIFEEQILLLVLDKFEWLTRESSEGNSLNAVLVNFIGESNLTHNADAVI